MSNESSGERTEKATPKKRRDAKENGQVLKSTEINTAASLLAMFGVLKLLSPYLGQRAMAFMQKYLSGAFLAGNDSMHYGNMFPHTINLVLDAMMILLPLMGAAVLVGLVVNLMQVGFVFSPKALKPKFSKLSPIQGFKRMFSTKAIVNLAISVVKVVILGKIVYDEYVNNINALPQMMLQPIDVAASWIFDTVLMIGIKVSVVMLFIGLFDYLYQWWSFEKDLRMTKQEVKDEYKMLEGDPLIKSKIRQKQRQMGMMRMMSAVPEADVVITNPTHYAIALRYREGEMAAPQVIAKGQDLVAKRIREVAAENGIEIIENKPVAQGLFFFCEVGDMIPENMYQAVAEILALVYRARKTA